METTILQGTITKTTEKYGGGICINNGTWYNFSPDLTPAQKARMSYGADVTIEATTNADGRWTVVKVLKSEAGAAPAQARHQPTSGLLEKLRQKYKDLPDDAVVLLRGKSNKEVVTYAGLLYMAKEEGLRETQSEVLDHAWGDFNVMQRDKTVTVKGPLYALVRVTIIMVQGDKFFKYQALGDATRENTGSETAMHLIRMAETRAFSRAYRQALNMDVAAEELEEEPDEKA